MRASTDMTRVARWAAAGCAVVVLAAAVAVGGAGRLPQARAASTSPACRLGTRAGAIRHVIFLQFDNVHLSRDNPNVPSDLQQMPTLMHFLTGNGVLLSREHTPLIAHTADDIVTSESGLYGDRQGDPISNTYNYYTPSGTTDVAGSFAYWRDPIVDYFTSNSAPVGDSKPTMVSPTGGLAPAPWTTYTEAGCNFGTVAAANTELENTVPDVPLVFGSHSWEAAEAMNPSLQGKAAADFEGLAVHCAHDSSACAPANGGVPDVLPDQPGGYSGYRALFGSRFVAPLISPGGPVKNLYGKVMTDGSGNVGFPGYNGMIGPNALAYTLDMQTHGVPVTYTYLTDLHESWVTGNPLGPGSPTYERQLRAEDHAFGVFFRRLAAAGINRQNTLFVVTADEGDHFVGGPPSPAGCNGVTVACNYSKIGELDVNLPGVLQKRLHVTVPFDVADDSAPGIYVHGQPSPSNASVRTLERSLGQLRVQDPLTGGTAAAARYLAGPTELRILHMITGDSKRTPTTVMFGNPNYWFQSGSPSCTTTCVAENRTEAWNHGTIDSQINTTWLGLVGPGVRHIGETAKVWSDHTDIRPTMLELLGIHDRYQDQGRVLFEALTPRALPAAVATHQSALVGLARAYKQIQAPVGRFGRATLTISTRALAGGSPANDSTYTRLEAALTSLGHERDALAGRMLNVLTGAEFANTPVPTARVHALIQKADALLAQVQHLATG